MSVTVKHVVLVLTTVLVWSPRAAAQVAEGPEVPDYAASRVDTIDSMGADRGGVTSPPLGEATVDPVEGDSRSAAGAMDDPASLDRAPLDAAPVAPANPAADRMEDQGVAWDARGLAGRAGRALGAWGAAATVALERWGVSPAVALLGLVGALLMAWGGRSVLLGRRGTVPEPPRRRGPARTSRRRPPRRPACRDAARLEEALRARKVA